MERSGVVYRHCGQKFELTNVLLALHKARHESLIGYGSNKEPFTGRFVLRNVDNKSKSRWTGLVVFVPSCIGPYENGEPSVTSQV